LLLQDFIKDIAPDATLPVNITNLGDSHIVNELEHHDERLKSKINALERELQREKRAHVSTAERAQSSQEGIQRELLALKKLLKEEHSDCDPMSHQMKVEYQENIGKLRALQSTLEQQIEHNASSQRQMETMHKNALQVTTQQSDNEKQHTRLLESQLASLQEEMKRINEEKREIKHELSQSKLLNRQQGTRKGKNGGRRRSLASLHGVDSALNIGGTNSDDWNGRDGSGGGGEEMDRYRKQLQSLKRKYKENDAKYKNRVQELKNRVSELESIQMTNGDVDQDASSQLAWERVRVLEKEKATLLAQYEALEAEHKAMESHYKKEILKYKKLVNKLKK